MDTQKCLGRSEMADFFRSPQFGQLRSRFEKGHQWKFKKMPFSVSGDRPGHFDIRLVLGQICVDLDCPKSALCHLQKSGFFCRIMLALAQKWRRSWGRSGASWRHLEAPYGFKFFFTYIKSYMSYNLCSINFFVWPLLLGAPLLIEVGGDQEPPGNTSRYPMGSKNFLLILNHIWATICLL